MIKFSFDTTRFEVPLSLLDAIFGHSSTLSVLGVGQREQILESLVSISEYARLTTQIVFTFSMPLVSKI